MQMKKQYQNEDDSRLRPISLHPRKLEDVLRAFMKVEPEKKGGEDDQQRGAHENDSKA